MIVPGSANSLLLGQTSGAYALTKSLRLRSSASAYLSRTYGTPTNSKIWTFSTWIKRGKLGANQEILNGNSSGSQFYFQSNDTLNFYDGTSGAEYITTQVFRDPSAYYHIIVAMDTTQSTASNRTKIYVNGSQITAFGTATTATQNNNSAYNVASTLFTIGVYNPAPNNYLDGYFAETNFIDGQQLTPSSFGANDATTGVWQPIKYTGTYGTNGFYLPFTNTSSTTTLGYDFSGNSNNWTTNNISVTSGATYDSMTDVPTLTSATTANYCVLNPLSNNGNTISAANLNATMSTGTSPYYGTFGVKGTIGVRTGKWYWEIIPTSKSSYTEIGITDINWPNTSDAIASGSYGVVYYGNGSGQKIVNGASSAYGTNYASNDVIGVALDCDGGTITFYKNNSSQGAITLPSSSVYYTPLVANAFAQADVFTCNFGQQPFAYTPPTGYVALNTYNLPTSTIVAGNKVMDATTYTGTGATNNVANAGTFKPDLVWIKNRSSANSHQLTDSVRGVNLALASDLTIAEYAGNMNAFNSGGFQVTSSSNAVNASGQTYVGWQWQAGQGTTSSNTNGSITSTVSVNPTAGFSIATFTTASSGTSFTYGHGLGVAPSFCILKITNSSTNWSCYHVSIGNTGNIFLNATNATNTTSGAWNNTSPTSSVVTVGSSYVGGVPMVAYNWAEIAGFSKFGSYTGNGSANGPFAYTGFRPRFLMIKRTDSAGGWFMVDTARNPYNIANLDLFANASDAEAAINNIDILSNGFRPTDSNSGTNASGGSFIYMAFAENPFKNALAR